MKKTIQRLGLCLTLLCLPCAPAFAQEPKTGTLSEEELAKKFNAIAQKIDKAFRSGKGTLEGLAGPLKEMDQLVTEAKDPKGQSAANIQMTKARILMNFGKIKEGLAILDAVLVNHKTGKIAQGIVVTKARHYIETQNLVELKKLNSVAKDSKLSQPFIEQIKGLYYIVKAQKLGEEGKSEEIKLVLENAKAAKVVAKMIKEVEGVYYHSKAEALRDAGKAEEIKALLEEAKKAKVSEGFLQLIEREIGIAKKIGKPFEDFKVKDTDGKELTLSSYKGKIVLIDFWATWCGPCMKEMPNVIKTYKKFHSQGFEIIGISLDQDETKLKKVLKEKEMTWRQYFDGKGWGNALAKKYGIQSIPATYLIGPDGNIIGVNLRKKSLERAVKKALKALKKSD
ncbi:MAG: TlpA disulfide reductase family protein [Planctomycetota bacterium]|nr:TlpA disulfide reductase family protein [Planctomycetota bacterium]